MVSRHSTAARGEGAACCDHFRAELVPWKAQLSFEQLDSLQRLRIRPAKAAVIDEGVGGLG
jgi:hypothetical protein